MPTPENKTSQSLTLEIDGPRITARKFRKSLNAFLDVINEVVRKFSGNSKDISWIVSVRPGSAVIDLRPESESPSLPKDKVPELLSVIQEGFSIIESSSTKPPHFSDFALERAKSLAAVLDGDVDSIHIRLQNQTSSVTPKTLANVGSFFRTAYKSWGSVDGKLRIVSERQGYKFFVYDDVIEKYIPCYFADELLTAVLEAFGKRISVSGLISYRPDGEIKSIQVEEFRRFPDPKTLPGFDDIYGLLRGVE